MIPAGPRVALSLSIAGVVLILATTPMVPVSYTFVFHDNYKQAAISCQQQALNQTAYRACLGQYRYPPATVNGVTSLSYLLSGLGPPPLPSETIVSQGVASALVHFDRSGVSFAEGPFQAPTTLNPPGVVTVLDPEVLSGPNGAISFSAVIKNVGSTQIGITGVYFDYPGYGTNTTLDGVVWHLGSVSICGGEDLAPGNSCLAGLSLAPNDNLQAGLAYPLTWVVVGFDPKLPQLNSNGTVALFGLGGGRFIGGNFVYTQTDLLSYPGSSTPTVDITWVHAFIGLVNGERGAIPLNEDPALDAFAQTRFETAVSVYQISDYGFDAQASAFANNTGAILNEEILYPNGTSPSGFVTYLKSAAPGHWSELVSGAYSKYGYYLASGPAIAFNQTCPVKEVLGRNVNITQLAVQNGCEYQVINVLWFLIVLSS